MCSLEANDAPKEGRIMREVRAVQAGGRLECLETSRKEAAAWIAFLGDVSLRYITDEECVRP